MALYEYCCEKCNHQFEQIEPISSNETIKICPKCGETAKRIISHSSFQLKGSGWYSSDYKKPSPCTSANPESKACETCTHAKKADKTT